MVESTAPGLSAAWRVRRGFADSNLSLLVIANNARAKGNFPFRQPCTNRRRHCCIGGAQHPPNYLPTHKTSGHIGTEQSSQDTSRGETGVSRGRGHPTPQTQSHVVYFVPGPPRGPAFWRRRPRVSVRSPSPAFHRPSSGMWEGHGAARVAPTPAPVSWCSHGVSLIREVYVWTWVTER